MQNLKFVTDPSARVALHYYKTVSWNVTPFYFLGSTARK